MEVDITHLLECLTRHLVLMGYHLAPLGFRFVFAMRCVSFDFFPSIVLYFNDSLMHAAGN